MSRATVELAKTVHLHNGPETAIDDAITYRGELAALRAQLDAANRRNQAMAADLARVTVINAGQANIIWTQAHELDALRNRQPLTLTDRGDLGDGYLAGYVADVVME